MNLAISPIATAIISWAPGPSRTNTGHHSSIPTSHREHPPLNLHGLRPTALLAPILDLPSFQNPDNIAEILDRNLRTTRFLISRRAMGSFVETLSEGLVAPTT